MFGQRRAAAWKIEVADAQVLIDAGCARRQQHLARRMGAGKLRIGHKDLAVDVLAAVEAAVDHRKGRRVTWNGGQNDGRAIDLAAQGRASGATTAAASSSA